MSKPRTRRGSTDPGPTTSGTANLNQHGAANPEKRVYSRKGTKRVAEHELEGNSNKHNKKSTVDVSREESAFNTVRKEEMIEMRNLMQEMMEQNRMLQQQIREKLDTPVTAALPNTDNSFTPAMTSEILREDNDHLGEKKECYLINKNIAEFAGKLDENFESWESRTRLFFCQFRPNHARFTNLLKMSVTGAAYQVLMSTNPVAKTIDEIYDALRPTFGISGNVMDQLHSTKQEEGENVRKFYGRLKSVLTTMGISQQLLKSPLGQDWELHYFIKGLKPELSKKVASFHLCTIEETVSRAIKIEADTYGQKKTIRESQVFMMEDSRKNDGFISKANYKYKVDREKNGYRSKKCFNCQKFGHSFRKCFKATAEDKKKIEDNLEKYMNESNLSLNSKQGPLDNSKVNPSH